VWMGGDRIKSRACCEVLHQVPYDGCVGFPSIFPTPDTGSAVDGYTGT